MEHTHTHSQKGIMMVVVSLREGVLISTAKRPGSSSSSSWNDGLGQQMEETMKDISFLGDARRKQTPLPHPTHPPNEIVREINK